MKVIISYLFNNPSFLESIFAFIDALNTIYFHSHSSFSSIRLPAFGGTKNRRKYVPLISSLAINRRLYYSLLIIYYSLAVFSQKTVSPPHPKTRFKDILGASMYKYIDTPPSTHFNSLSQSPFATIHCSIVTLNFHSTPLSYTRI